MSWFVILFLILWIIGFLLEKESEMLRDFLGVLFIGFFKYLLPSLILLVAGYLFFIKKFLWGILVVIPPIVWIYRMEKREEFEK